MVETSNTSFTEQASATPVVTSTEQAGVVAPVTKEPEVLTRAEALKMFTEIAEQVSEKTLSKYQSLSDKMEARITKRVDQQLQVMKQAGVEVTAEVSKNIRQVVSDQVKAEDAATPSQVPTQAQQAPVVKPKEELHPVQAAALAILENQKVQLDDADPEVGMINVKTDNPGEYLASVFAAAQAKKERLSRPAGARVPPSAGGRTPGLQEGLSPMEYFSTAYKKE